MNELESIKKVLEGDYPNFVKSSDASGYAGMYTEETLWSPPGGPDQHTSSGINVAVAGLFKKISIDVSIMADEVEVYGSSAWVIGTANGSTTDLQSKEVSPFKYRLVWSMSKVGDVWQINRQVWNNKPVST